MYKTLRFLLPVLLILFQHHSYAQRIGMSGGMNLSSYYEFKEETPHYNSDYKNGIGYSFSIIIDDLAKKDSVIPFKFILQFSNYYGQANIYNSGLGAGNRKNIKINKSYLGLGMYPFNFFIMDRFLFSAGCKFEILLADNSRGTVNIWDQGNSGEIREFNEFENSNTIFGIIAEVQYEIPINNKIIIFPKYSTYFGLWKDILDANAWRNNFEIGFVMNIN